MIDRRVQQTRRSLHEALIALIQENGYDAITVRCVTERAKVGRSTFYAHYSDLEHLLQGGLDDLGKLLLAQQKASRTNHASLSFPVSRAIFEHAHGYRAVYRAMIGRNAGDVIAARMRKLLVQLVSDDLVARQATEQVNEVPREAFIEFIVGAMMSLLIWWVDARDDYTVDDMERIFRRLTKSERI